MRTLQTIIGGLAGLAISMIVIAGCNLGKQEAHKALLEARSNFSVAKGGDVVSYVTLDKAQSALDTAEQNFTQRRYAYARKAAEKANRLALQAQSEAAAMKAEESKTKPRKSAKVKKK